MNLAELKAKEKNLVEKSKSLETTINELMAEKASIDEELNELEKKFQDFAAQEQSKQNELAKLEQEREQLSLEIEEIPEVQKLEQLNKRIDELKGE
jgi:peptidoglycan hydrolase CwlO-like protein